VIWGAFSTGINISIVGSNSATNLVISSYRCTAMVPWCLRENNVHGSGQILSKKYCHFEGQEDENYHFKGVTARAVRRSPYRPYIRYP
jgi:hypothetical protein